MCVPGIERSRALTVTPLSVLELLDAYLNGPRTLSNSRLSYLIISEPARNPELLPTPPRTPSPGGEDNGEDVPAQVQEELSRERQFDFFLGAMHFLGDGIALHTFANDLFTLLGGEKTDDELRDMMQDEWRTRWETAPEEVSASP